MTKWLLSLVILFFPSLVPARAETVNCTEIASVPLIISVQGVYCLKKNLATSLASGSMIDIRTNNVTIDFNGFKLGGQAAGVNTTAYGVSAQDRRNITLRNGSILGFARAISLLGSPPSNSSGHVVEDMLLDANRANALAVVGTGVVIRRNQIVNTAGPVVTEVIVDLQSGVVEDNVIAETRASIYYATALEVTSSDDVTVRRNFISNTFSTFQPSIGIRVGSSSRVIVSDNEISTVTSSDSTGHGISASSSTVYCRNNAIIGAKTAPTSGCTAEQGTFP